MGKMDVHHSSENKKWETPDAFFKALDDLFHFDLDTCSTAKTAKVKRFISPEQDTFIAPWFPSSLPVDMLQQAYLLEKRLAKCKHLRRNTDGSEDFSGIGLCELESDECFFSLYSKIGENEFKNVDALKGGYVPCPDCPLFLLGSLFDLNSSASKDFFEELYRGLVSHANRNVERVVGRRFFSTRGFCASLLDAYAAFSIDDSGKIRKDNLWNYSLFHNFIIRFIGGFINNQGCSVGYQNPEYGDSENPCKANCEKKKCVKRGHHISEYVPGIKDFLLRAIDQSKAVKGRTVVVLLPARPDTEWFQNVFTNAELILFLRGRLTFKAGASTDPAPFPSAIAVFGKRPGDEVFEALTEWGNVIDPRDGGIILYTGARR